MSDGAHFQTPTSHHPEVTSPWKPYSLAVHGSDTMCCVEHVSIEYLELEWTDMDS